MDIRGSHNFGDLVPRRRACTPKRRRFPEVDCLEDRQLLSDVGSPVPRGSDQTPSLVQKLIRPIDGNAQAQRPFSLNGTARGKLSKHGSLEKFTGTGRIGSMGQVQVTVAESFNDQNVVITGEATLRNNRGSVKLVIAFGGTGFQVLAGTKAFASAFGAGTFSLGTFKHSATATFQSTSNYSLVYTWHETDGQSVTGSLVASSSALAAQQITSSDVISFEFTVGSYTITAANLDQQDFPIPIAAPLGYFSEEHPHAGLNAELNPGSSFPIAFGVGDNADSNSPNPLAESGWELLAPAGRLAGSGYWTVSTE